MKVAPGASLRKPLLFALICAYIVACLLLILYALGYVVRPSSEELQRTGGIFVASTPPGASFWVNGKPYPTKTPAAVLQLRPGPYNIRLALDGYRTLEQRIFIAPGRVTTLGTPLLVPAEGLSAEVSPDWFLNMIPAPGYPYLLLQRGRRVEDLVVYDMPNHRFLAVADEDLASADAPLEACLTVPGSSDFLLEAGSGSSLRIVQVKTQWPRPFQRDLTDILPFPHEAPQWVAENPEDVFTYNGASVDRTNVPSRKVTRGIVTQASGYGLYGRWLYAITWQRKLLRVDYQRQIRQDLPQFDRAISGFPVETFVQVRPLTEDLILLLGAGGRFTVAAQGSSGVNASAVRGYQEGSQAGRILIWDQHRLAIITAQDMGTELAMEWLRLYGKDIQQAYFVLADKHLLYRDGNGVFLASRLQNGEWQATPVVTVRLGTSIYYTERDGSLYYIDSGTGKLFAMQLIPRQQVIEQLMQQLRHAL